MTSLAMAFEPLLAKLPASVAEPMLAHPHATAATALVGVLVLIAVLAIKMGCMPNLANKKPSNTNVGSYTELFDGTVEGRKDAYMDVVNTYYDRATDFYTFGWGMSFHFAHRFEGESFQASLIRHEHYLASQLGVKAGDRVVDLGCGVGGPARNIAKFAGVQVVGLNNNAYQLQVANRMTKEEHVDHLVSFTKGNFMAPPFADETFDAAYAIEATCHAPDRTKCFSEVLRQLKPGATFAGYEWVMTDKYDASNPEHAQIKYGIEIGDGLPDLTGEDDVRDALAAAGFVDVELRDLALSSPVAWYEPFEPKLTWSGWRTTPMGIKLVNAFVWALEKVGFAPEGSALMHTHLSTAAKTLTAGGRSGIFTPMLFFSARKPTEAEAEAEASPVAAAEDGSAAPRGRSRATGATRRR